MSSNIIDFNKYLIIKQEQEFKESMCKNPTNDMFKEYSKLFQKDYPVLKYLCQKSKINKLNGETDSIVGIFDLPKNYYNYIYSDVMSSYLQIYIPTKLKFKRINLDEYYFIIFKYRSLNEYDEICLEYPFLLSGHIVEELLAIFEIV